MKNNTLFNKKTRVELVIILGFTIGTSLYVYFLNDYIQPFISGQFINLLFSVVIFSFLMKMIKLGKMEDITYQNIFQILLQMIYEFRYPIFVIMVLTFLFGSSGKPSSLIGVMTEYHKDITQERVLTIYEKIGHEIYDQNNLTYHLYNDKVKIKPNSTYRIKFLKSSHIVVNVQGPLPTKSTKKIDHVLIKEAQIKNGEATLKWFAFRFNGEQTDVYRIKTFIKQPNGKIMRSGPQIIVKNGQTSVKIPNILPNREYRFIIEPQIEGHFSEALAATSGFLEMQH